MHENAISEFLTGNWFITEQARVALMPRLSAILKGESAIKVNDAAHNLKPQPPSQVAAGLVEVNPWYGGYGIDELPEGSTCIVDLVGPIMKYSYYNAGTLRIARLLQMLDASPKVSCVVLRIDSGGGTVQGTRELGDAIQAMTTKTCAYIDGMAASAALWIAAACDSMWCNHEGAEVGSIGVYLSLADWYGYYEKEGLKIRDIYSSLSTEKNKDYIEALKGNDKPLIKHLDRTAGDFIAFIKERRPNIDTTKSDPFKGRMYFADEALSIGLIDGIGTMAEMLGGAASAKKQAITNPNTNMNLKATILGFFKKGTQANAVSADDVTAINSQLAADGVRAYVVAATDDIPDHATLQAGLDAAGTEMERLTGELSTANATITTLTTERDNARTEASTKGNTLGAITAFFGDDAKAEGFDLVATVAQAVKDAKAYHTKPAGDGPEGTSAKGVADVQGDAVNIDELDHNKRADAMGLGPQSTPTTK